MTLAIAAILATLAAPSVVQFARRSEMQSLSNDFLSDLQRTRTEAVTRNACATMCRTANPDSASPKCSTTASGNYTSAQWQLGWIAYHNPTCDRTVTASDPSDAGNIFLIRQPADTRFNLTATASSPSKSLTFGPQGNIPLASADKFNLIDSTDTSSILNRSICIDVMGRARIIAYAGSC